MRNYRYVVVDERGRPIEEHPFTAINDAAALQRAKGWRDERPAEIWGSQGRLAKWRLAT